MKTFFRMTLAIAAISMPLALSATAQDKHAGHDHSTHSHASSAKPETGPKGGSIQTVGILRVESVIMDKGFMFIVYDLQGKTVNADSGAGKLTLKINDNPKTYDYKLGKLKNGWIGAAIDLSKVAGHSLHLDVELVGVGNAPLRFHAMGKLHTGPTDALLISLQKTCPITGGALGSMGAPPKIMIDGKPIFVCCAGCTGKVEAEPKKYINKYYSAKGAELRPGVFESTLADASAITAQKKCPVMDEDLGGMGVPQKVNVKGKAVYICCAGCAKKLTAEPDKYLTMLLKSGITPPDFK